MTVILEAKNLTKSYGGVRVVDDLSVSLLEGEALGVVGPNGAGKTTMLNLLTGIANADLGTVVFAGQDISQLAPDERCHLGLGRTYQIPKPFEGMTVFENVLVGATYGRGKSEKASYELCTRALQRTSLLPQANVLAETLSLLQRKRLELARALAIEPKVLLLDEIAGGLTEHEMQSLMDTIRQLRAEGIGIIWIEHIVHALLAVVDRLMAIDFGKLIAEGDPTTVINSPEVRDVYMGSMAP